MHIGYQCSVSSLLRPAARSRALCMLLEEEQLRPRGRRTPFSLFSVRIATGDGIRYCAVLTAEQLVSWLPRR